MLRYWRYGYADWQIRLRYYRWVWALKRRKVLAIAEGIAFLAFDTFYAFYDAASEHWFFSGVMAGISASMMIVLLMKERNDRR